MGKMHKKNPQVALPGVSALLSMRGAHPPRPTIQDGTGLWDGVDRLNPSKALVLPIYPSATENQPTKEVQSEHNANADPVAECRSIKQRHSQPVPQKHENPALQAEHSEHNAQNKGKAEDDDDGAEQATAGFIDAVNRVFHSFLIPFLFDD